MECERINKDKLKYDQLETQVKISGSDQALIFMQIFKDNTTL